MQNNTDNNTDTEITRDLGLTNQSGGCACCSTADGSAAKQPAAVEPAVTEEFLVSGMTCGHCVASVTEELSALDGVDSVTVDLHAGGASRVTVASARALPVENVRAAVTEAGYDLVSTD